MKSAFLNIIKTTLAYFILCIATILMAQMIVLYASFDDKVGFLAFKQEYLPNLTWKICFYVHVFSSLFCLLAGFTQFSTHIQIHYTNIHRIIGKLYVGNILFVNFPTALVMAYYANGFLPSKIAFFILDVLWFGFTLKALIEIRKGNIESHTNYMMRSYALTFSAITLRTWKIILSYIFIIDPLTLYMIDSWLGFVPNLLIAEFIIWNRRKNFATKKNLT